VKGKKDDKMLRELFRQKLENAELVPDPSVGPELFKKLARKEFLHFNPARFNIWYAGGIAVAGAALAIVLSSGQEKVKKESPAISPVENSQSATSDDLQQDKIQYPDKNLVKNSQAGNQGRGKGSKRNPETGNNKLSERYNQNQNTGVGKPAGSTATLAEKGLFGAAGTEKNKLREGAINHGSFIIASVSEGCTPLKVKFRNSSVLSDSCLWSFGDGGFSVEKEPEWLFDVPGEYKVTLNVFGPNNFRSDYSTSVIVHPRPSARFEITPEDAILPDDEIRFHNYSVDAVRFKWYFGDGNSSELSDPEHNYKKYGKYDIRLVAISDKGCRDSIIVSNAFSGSGYFIDFPNAFIPNPDGPSNGYYSTRSDEASQVFHPIFSGVSEYQLKVFSRRGLLIFESNDINTGWDGYYKGQLSEPGVYIWKVRGNFMNGEPFTKMGDVTLLKN
jgi:PKD repeat protein